VSRYGRSEKNSVVADTPTREIRPSRWTVTPALV
jgi:hypothetical protein